MIKAASDTQPKLTRADVDAAKAQLRQQASQLAGRTMRGPRIASRPTEFRLTYRAGRSCVVRTRLARAGGIAALRAPTWTQNGC